LHLDNLEPKDASFLKACLIGDGWLGLQRRKYVHLRIGHSVKQLPWLQWKAERINRILGKDRAVLGPYWQTSGDTSEKRYESYLYTVDDHSLFSPWFERWYSVGEDRVTKRMDQEFLEGIDLQGLAILWCDDGSAHSSERVKKHRLKSGEIREYPYVEGKGTIATCCFTEQENMLIADWVESLTGVRFGLQRSKGYLRLGIGKEKLRTFLEVIAPYVPDCMKYKVNLSHCRTR